MEIVRCVKPVLCRCAPFSPLTGNLYMKLVEDGVVPGYPKPSNTQWSGVNGVDAAMTLNEQGQTITYLFTVRLFMKTSRFSYGYFYKKFT